MTTHTLKFITLVTQTLLLLLTEDHGLQQSYNANHRLRSTMKMVILHKIATVCAVTQTTNRFSLPCSFPHFIFTKHRFTFFFQHQDSNFQTFFSSMPHARLPSQEWYLRHMRPSNIQRQISTSEIQTFPNTMITLRIYIELLQNNQHIWPHVCLWTVNFVLFKMGDNRIFNVGPIHWW